MTSIAELCAGVADGITRPTRHVILERGPHYIQFAFGDDGRTLAEVVSNKFLLGEARLLGFQVEALKELGWNMPAAGCELAFCEMAHPNFWRYFGPPTVPAVVAAVVEATAAAVFYAPLSAFTFRSFDYSSADDGCEV